MKRLSSIELSVLWRANTSWLSTRFEMTFHFDFSWQKEIVRAQQKIKRLEERTANQEKILRVKIQEDVDTRAKRNKPKSSVDPSKASEVLQMYAF